MKWRLLMKSNNKKNIVIIRKNINLRIGNIREESKIEIRVTLLIHLFKREVNLYNTVINLRISMLIYKSFLSKFLTQKIK